VIRKRAIATVCMPGTFADKLGAAAEAGYQGIEIFENDLTYFDGRSEDVRGLAGSLGLEIIALQPFRDFEGLPEPARSRAFERARRKFELTGRLGTPLLLVCSSISPEVIDDMSRVAADLHELGELARGFGVRLGFEALAWGRHINDYRQAWEAVRHADQEHVGLILDSFHMLARRLPVDDIGQIPAQRIVLVQTADAPGIEMDLLFLSRHYRCFPGQGDLPVAAMMRRLDEIDYRGRSATRSSATIFALPPPAGAPATACARSCGSTSRSGVGRPRRCRPSTASSSSSSSTTRTRLGCTPCSRSRDGLLRRKAVRGYPIRQTTTPVPVEGAWQVAHCPSAQAPRSRGAGSRTDRRATGGSWPGSRTRRSTRSGRCRH
jgi:sugar phosphate isomerase/epimerase